MPIAKLLLEQYYDLWRKGETAFSIKRELKLDDEDFKDGQPEFLYYCRCREKEAFRKGCAEGTYSHLSLTAERREDFLDHLGSGLNVSEACLVMGVPLPTLYDVWYVKDPDLKYMAENIAMLQNAKIKKSLFKRAQGRTYLSRSRTRTTGQGAEGRIDMTVESVVEKEVEPDVNAIKLWLINRDPDNWSESGAKGSRGNMGTIMDAIEASVEKGSQIYDEEQMLLEVEDKTPERIKP